MKKRKLDQKKKEYEDFVLPELKDHNLKLNDPKNYDLVQNKIFEERMKAAQDRDDLPIYQKFDKLEYAIKENKRDDYKNNMPIFACNYPSSKKNFFVLTSYNTLWHALLKTKKHLLNFYEQMRPMDPCHGFIDVEIYKEPNKDRFDDEYLESKVHLKMMAELKEHLKDLSFIKNVDDDKEVRFLIAEASNSKKISLHIHMIIHLKRFKNVYHFGSFMRSFVMKIQQKYGHDPIKNPFFFKIPSKTTSETADNYLFWADMAIYTLNRNFRMFYNTKSHDYRPLLPIDITKINRSKGGGVDNTGFLLDKDIWFDSLLQRMTIDEIKSKDFKLLTLKDPITGKEPISSSDCSFLRTTTIIPSLKNKSNGTSISNTLSFYNNMNENNKNKKIKYSFSNKEDELNSIRLFNDIGDMILKKWQLNDSEIKNVVYYNYNENWKVIYYSTNSRYCYLKGQNHEGNHIRFEFNLSTNLLYQKCFDTLCLNKSFDPINLLDTSQIEYDSSAANKISKEDQNKIDLHKRISSFLKNQAINMELRKNIKVYFKDLIDLYFTLK